MSKPRSVLRFAGAVAVVAALAATTYFSSDHWLPYLLHSDKSVANGGPSHEPTATTAATAPTGKVLLSDQAIANLGIWARAVHPGTFWKTIQVPGLVVDRPGLSDRGVVAPASGVVTRVNYFPGDTVKPGEELFTIRLLSETLHSAQSDLFKATQDITLAQAQRKRLLTAGGAIPEARVIEVDNQITRLEVAVKAHRRELLTRGLDSQQIDAVAEGKFVSEIAVHVPSRSLGARPLTSPVLLPASTTIPETRQPTFEVQELKVDLGQQVTAGQTLCLLANHQMLAVEGRAFRDETPLLERSVKEKWPVEVDFHEDAAGGWPPLTQVFHIRYMANTIDPVHRTFAFLMPLENESKVFTDEGRTHILWRFRPGQKVRVLVRVEKLDNVLILPAEAVTRDGAEAFVFTQNVNTFERKSIRVLAQDRKHAVVANDGALLVGSFVVQGAAAQLNRLAKSHSGGAPTGYHVHADGSLHKNGEDEK